LLDHNNDKHFFSLAISSMKSSERVEYGTGLIVGTENSATKRSSLQLRIETSVTIVQDAYEVWHNGSITIGKKGAAKRAELIEFIKKRKPQLVINCEIFLGKFKIDQEIKSNDTETIKFLKNIFDYCLLRDEFREIKKAITN